MGVIVNNLFSQKIRVCKIKFYIATLVFLAYLAFAILGDEVEDGKETGLEGALTAMDVNIDEDGVADAANDVVDIELEKNGQQVQEVTIFRGPSSSCGGSTQRCCSKTKCSGKLQCRPAIKAGKNYGKR